MFRKLIGTLAALLIYPYPEIAIMVFLLWLWWDHLWPKALTAYEENRISHTRKALKKSLSARVNPRYACMMAVIDREERERKARFRQRWKSRFRSWWRFFVFLYLYATKQVRTAESWAMTVISVRSVEGEVDE